MWCDNAFVAFEAFSDAVAAETGVSARPWQLARKETLESMVFHCEGPKKRLALVKGIAQHIKIIYQSCGNASLAARGSKQHPSPQP